MHGYHLLNSLVKCNLVMKQLLVFAACLVATSGWGQWNPGLSVRYGPTIIGARSSFFIPVPLTASSAKNSRWVKTKRPDGPLPSLIMMCPSQNDVVLCALYDDLGDIAGLQIALPEDLTTDFYFDMEALGFIRWTAPANQSGVERSYLVTQQFFVSEETLRMSKEERMASRVEGKVLKEEAVWVTSFNGELMRISGSASEIANTATTSFTEQACIPLMGRHYFYNMSADTACTSKTILPWFALVDKGTDQLIGMGFLTAAQLPSSALIRDYFERPPRVLVKAIIPNGPECVYDLTDDPGALTMHIYYVDAPFFINCFNN